MCIICIAIKKGTFPFININEKYYIDSEGCIEDEATEIKYCPKCGKELKK